MPFGWGESHDAYQQVQDGQLDENKAEFSHELLGGAGAFAAMKVFEDHQRKEGKTVNHAFAKELIAGFAGAEVDRLAETKGADFVDREKAKRHARESAENMYDEQYGNQDQYDPNNSQPHERLQQQYGNNW